MFSAIQYASGNDLRGTLGESQASVGTTGVSTAFADRGVSQSGVNRAAKSDRAVVIAHNDSGQTLSFRVDGLSDTSVLVRIAGTATPFKSVAQNTRAIPVSAKPQRAAVACEPPVSVLTDVAKLIQPGRCVT